MDAYTGFAAVYDRFMDNVPYDEWAKQTVHILRDYGIRNGIMADLGCGTGNLTEKLSAAGFDMIGIDNSEDMLSLAMEKRAESGADILYLLQDMREFELYGTCRAIISRCDSLNYLENTEDLTQVFRLVNNYLDPKGIFLFDVNTLYKYEKVLGDNTFAESREECSFIWENSYDSETRTNEYDLTLFIRESGETEEDGDAEEDEEPLFRRYMETHYQHAFTMEELETAAEAAGLVWLDCLDADTMEAPKKETERYLIVLMESGK